jgi:hypothetical protein
MHSNMSKEDYLTDLTDEPKRFFSIDEANAMLPLVRAITTDLVELAREVIDRRERLAVLTEGRDIGGSDLYSQELVHVQEELNRDLERLQGYVQELQELGVEPKGPAEGLVDFPALLDGRPVYLCWKHGEAEVLHWHEIDAGFAGRQPLCAGVGTGGDAGDEGLSES